VKFLADTREKLVWPCPKGHEMARVTLPHGDYSVEGFEHRCVVERKSIDDLVGSAFGDWKRWSARLAELAHFERACVVVECTEEDIRKRKYVPNVRSTRRLGAKAEFTSRVLDKLEPGKVLLATASIFATYGVPVFLAGSPTRAASFAFSVLHQFVTHQRIAK
jgi:ERCC4-type nuclease